MQIAQPCPVLHAEERLTSKDQTGEDANCEHASARIPQQQGVRHGLTPVGSPVAKEIPADRANRENAEDRVKDQPPLNHRMKGTKGHCEA